MRTDSFTAIKALSKAVMDSIWDGWKGELPEQKESRGDNVLKCTRYLFQSGMVRWQKQSQLPLKKEFITQLPRGGNIPHYSHTGKHHGWLGGKRSKGKAWAQPLLPWYWEVVRYRRPLLGSKWSTNVGVCVGRVCSKIFIHLWKPRGPWWGKHLVVLTWVMTLDAKSSTTESQEWLLYVTMVQIKCLTNPTLVSLERNQERKGLGGYW